MNTLQSDYRTVLLADHDGPCVSLFQPTHRSFPDRQQDPIRYGNLVRQVEASLAQHYTDRQSAALLQPLHALAKDDAFWNHTLDGLAIFATSTLFKVYRLQRTVQELAIVADSFHTKPLLRILQSADRYHVLGLNRHEASLFEGNRYALDQVALDDDVPQSRSDVVGEYDGEPERAKRAHGASGTGQTTRHGMNLRQKLREKDTSQFFRAVDEAVLETYSRPTGLPLLLAALPEHHHPFREVSRNPFLISDAIDVDPASVPADDLRARAWDLVLPAYLARLQGFVDQYGAARAEGGSSPDLSDIGRAAAAGRIATLLIDADRVIPGRFDPESGAVEFAPLEDPDVDDMLDDLGEHTLKSGGEVVIVPSENMPTDTGIAAIYRY